MSNPPLTTKQRSTRALPWPPHVAVNWEAASRIHRQRDFGNVLELRFGPREPAAPGQKPILLLGHLDTVWPLGTLKTMPCRIANGRLWGPGTLDMKVGVAMAFTALELLTEAGLLQREIVLLLNGDEEIGSPVSRPITEKIAESCSAVYVLEPAQGLAYKTARKGIGNWRIEVEGVAAHAGVDFEKGANAIRELARVIEKVSGWTDLKRGLTVSALGVAGGGTKSNVIPAHAWAEVEVRIVRRADGPRIAAQICCPQIAQTRAARSPSPAALIARPWSAARGTVRLFRQAQALAVRSWLCPRRSRDRRRLRWKLHRRARHSLRSTAWAPWAKARTRATSRFWWSISPRAPRCWRQCCWIVDRLTRAFNASSLINSHG